MAIGARDKIDKMLVKKYANEKVENHNISHLAVPAEEMMQTMNDYAATQRNMLALHSQLSNVCKSVNVKYAYNRA